MEARDEPIASDTDYFEMAMFKKPSLVYDTLVRAIKHCAQKVIMALTFEKGGRTKCTVSKHPIHQELARETTDGTTVPWTQSRPSAAKITRRIILARLIRPAFMLQQQNNVRFLVLLLELR